MVQQAEAQERAILETLSVVVQLRTWQEHGKGCADVEVAVVVDDDGTCVLHSERSDGGVEQVVKHRREYVEGEDARMLEEKAREGLSWPVWRVLVRPA